MRLIHNNLTPFYRKFNVIKQWDSIDSSLSFSNLLVFLMWNLAPPRYFTFQASECLGWYPLVKKRPLIITLRSETFWK